MGYLGLKITALAPTALLTLWLPCQAQELPTLQQGQPYNTERQKLLNSGWQKVIDYTKNCDTTAYGTPRNGFSRDTCFKYQEHDDCSGTGYCTFAWRNAYDSRLKVVTYGGEYRVLNWTVE